jgi:hypothetical protein
MRPVLRNRRKWSKAPRKVNCWHQKWVWINPYNKISTKNNQKNHADVFATAWTCFLKNIDNVYANNLTVRICNNLNLNL